MHVESITYIDYDGNKRTEDHYFNLNKAEIIKWLITDGDYTLDKKIERLYEERNGKKIMETFEELIYMSYGKKSLDGRRFDKSEEVKRDFMETEAYTELFTSIVSDAKKAAAFFNGIVPREMADEIKKAFEENPNGIPAEVMDYAPPTRIQ